MQTGRSVLRALSLVAELHDHILTSNPALQILHKACRNMFIEPFNKSRREKEYRRIHQLDPPLPPTSTVLQPALPRTQGKFVHLDSLQQIVVTI